MVLFLWVPFFCAAQITIKGVVADSISQPLSYAIVTAYKDSSYSTIIGFKTANEAGEFNIKLGEPIDSVFLEARHISFKPEQFVITNFNKLHKLTLFRLNNELKEVLVEAQKSIEIKGDTIRYDVEALKEKKDYTIEEVIKRIPGITVAENGQIAYNEQPISHLYLNGVDLLEGRYNIATRGIPAEAVKDIEVLRRHNHARIDIGRTLSNEVALNLKIKKDQKLLFGTAIADIGTPLTTARGEVTPIYLKEKVQNIASLLGNNIGKSLQEFGTSLTRGNLEISQLKLANTAIITPPEVEGNTISNRYWLDNTSASATNDMLVSLPNELIIKGSLDYNFEDSNIEKNNRSIFFTGNDSLQVTRNSLNKLTQTRYQIGNTIEINRDDLYINNKLSALSSHQDGRSLHVLNGDAINADFRNKNRAVTNIMEVKNTINNQIIDSGMLFEYKAVDELLQTNPAVFTDVIPGIAPEFTSQDIHIEKFNIAGHSGYTFNLFNIQWKARQSLKVASEQLQSLLNNQNDNGNASPFATDFKMQTFESRTQLSSTFDWKRIRFTINPDATFYDVHRSEKITDTQQNDRYLFLNMTATASHSFNLKWDAGASGSVKNSIPRFDALYPGTILRQFDNLSTNPQDINVMRTNDASIFFSYSDVLSGYLLKNNTTYSSTTSEFIFNRTLDERGLIQITAIRQDNQFSTLRNVTSLSKRFFKHLSTQSNYYVDVTTIEQIFNNSAQKNTLINHTINTTWSWSKGGFYALNYEGTINFGLSLVDDSRATNTFQLHNLGIDLYLSEKTRWSFNSETAISSFSSSSNTNVNTLFNSSFYYQPHKKLFLRAELYNIFNERFFTTATSGNNAISLNQFSLRPLQFTIGLNYTL